MTNNKIWNYIQTIETWTQNRSIFSLLKFSNSVSAQTVQVIPLKDDRHFVISSANLGECFFVTSVTPNLSGTSNQHRV